MLYFNVFNNIVICGGKEFLELNNLSILTFHLTILLPTKLALTMFP